MRKALVRRIERLEDRQATAQQLEEQWSGWSAAIHDAMVIGLALQLGANAREELDAANGSLDPGRRAELTKRVEGARSIAAMLRKYKQVSEGERYGITG